MSSRGSCLLLLLVACRREVTHTTAREIPAPADVVTAVPAPPTVAPRCEPAFVDEAVTLPAGVAPELACDGSLLAARWRVEGQDAWAHHALRDGSRWERGASPPTPSPLGASLLVHEGVAHAVTVERDLSLAHYAQQPFAERARATLTTLRLREPSAPRLLRVQGDRALLALNARVSGAEREVWLVAFGGGATAVSSMGRGTLGTVAPGALSLLTAVVTQPDRSVVLRGRWLDTDAALRAMVAGVTTLRDAWRSDASIPLPHRGIAFSPAATEAGALLYQGVIGAERGAAGFARFEQGGAVEDVFLGVIPSALGDVVSVNESHTARWWDERYRLRVRSFARGDAGVEPPPGAAVGNAFAALDAARLNRWMRCGAITLRVTVQGGAMRVRRDDCPR